MKGQEKTSAMKSMEWGMKCSNDSRWSTKSTSHFKEGHSGYTCLSLLWLYKEAKHFLKSNKQLNWLSQPSVCPLSVGKVGKLRIYIKKKTSLQISSVNSHTVWRQKWSRNLFLLQTHYHTNSRRHKYLQQLKSMCKCLGTSFLGIMQPWQHSGGSSNSDD